MSRRFIGAGLFLLMAGMCPAQNSSQPAEQNAAQDTSSPFGLPPPFQAPAAKKAEAPAESGPDAPAPKKAQSAAEKAELPPEEDKTDTPTEFSFNPVESKSQVMKGDFYFKKGNYVAAASRYDEATKWNDGNAEAWLRLGEAQEKKSDGKAARSAYEKYLALQPDAKNAAEIRKRLAKLKD